MRGNSYNKHDLHSWCTSPRVIGLRQISTLRENPLAWKRRPCESLVYSYRAMYVPGVVMSVTVMALAQAMGAMYFIWVYAYKMKFIIMHLNSWEQAVMCLVSSQSDVLFFFASLIEHQSEKKPFKYRETETSLLTWQFFYQRCKQSRHRVSIMN